MPRGRNNNDDDILKAQNDSQLELIKLNVEKVKKDISDVSIFTKKEIDSVVRKMDQLIARVEKSNQAMAKKNMSAYEFMAASQDKLSKEQEKAAQKQLDGYMKYINEVLKGEKELQKQKEETAKKQEEIQKQQREGAKELLDIYQHNQQEMMAKQKQQQTDTKNAISEAIKGNFGNIAILKNNMKKQNVLDQMDAIKTAVGDGKMSAAAGKKQMSGLLDQMKALDTSGAKIQAGAQVFQVAADGFKKIMSNWLNRFTTGMDKIIDTYESTFQAQAVQTQISEDQYFDRQRDMQESLNKQGLQNNIAITDVMQATADFTKSGITNMTQAMSMGEQSAISKVLAPYLDMQSESMTSLEIAMPGITKSLAGIGAHISDTVGQNRFTVKNLQSLIDLTEPISLSAKKDMLGEEGLAMIEDLVSKGMDMQTATQMATDIADAVRDPLGKGINSNNVAIASAIAAGKRDFTGIASYAMETERDIMRGTDKDLGSAAALDSAGLWGVYNYDFEKNFGEAINNLKAGKYKGDTSSKYQERLQRLANDQYTTALSEKEILAQSLSLDMAIAQEKWPDLMSVIRAILPGIAQLFGVWIGGKLLGKAFGLGGGKGGLLSGAGSKLAGFGGTLKTGLTSGFAPGAAKVAGAGKLGFMSGTGGAIAGAAGVAAGGAMAIKGGMDVYSDIKNNDVSWKTGASAVGAAGGAVGAGALLALGASNPIGWAALAVGGAALGIRKFGEMMEKQKEALGDSMVQMTEQIDNEIKEREKDQDKQMRQLKIAKEQVNRSTDLESAKRILIENGISTEEELQKAQYNNKEALLALTDTYIASTKKLNQDSNQITKDLKTMVAKDKSDYINSTKDFMSYLVKGVGQKKMYKIDDSERALTEETIRAVATYGKANYDKLDDNQKKIVDKIRNTGSGDGIGLNWEEIDSIVNEMDNHKTEMGTLINAALGDSSILQEFSTNELAMQRLGNKSQYLGFDENKAASLLTQALESGVSDDRARSLLDQFKSVTMIDDVNKFPDATKEKINSIVTSHNLGSYAIGSDYISANGQLAYLHEGEAVLTKTAADILRSQTSASISTAHGVSSALLANSSMSTEHIASIVTAISNQTMQLIQKMDQIINSISAGRRISPYDQSMINLGSSKA